MRLMDTFPEYIYESDEGCIAMRRRWVSAHANNPPACERFVYFDHPLFRWFWPRERAIEKAWRWLRRRAAYQVVQNREAALRQIAVLRETEPM